MRLLVTGAAGYIGTHVVVSLVERGHDVVGLDSFARAKRSALAGLDGVLGRRLPVGEADVRDGRAVAEALGRHRIDAVVHCAGLKSVDESVREPLEYWDVNVGGTLTLLRAMQEQGVRRLVFSSSAVVYGASSPSPVGEEAPTGPVSPYGATKLAAERLIADVCGADPTFSAAVLRYFNPIGAHPSGRIGEDPLGVPANLLPFVAQVAAGRRPEVLVRGDDYPTPDGTGVRDYLHVMDLAEGHVSAVDHLTVHTGLGVWNLGTGSGTSVLDVIHAFARVSGAAVPYRITDRRPGDVAVSYADPTRAGKDLGWTTRRSLDDACRDLWNWQQSNPSGYPD